MCRLTSALLLSFDKVNHQGFHYKHSSVGIGGSVLCVGTQFLSNRSQDVLANVCRSKLVNVVFRSATEQCFGPVVVPSVYLGTFFKFWRIS